MVGNTHADSGLDDGTRGDEGSPKAPRECDRDPILGEGEAARSRFFVGVRALLSALPCSALPNSALLCSAIRRRSTSLSAHSLVDAHFDIHQKKNTNDKGVVDPSHRPVSLSFYVVGQRPQRQLIHLHNDQPSPKNVAHSYNDYTHKIVLQRFTRKKNDMTMSRKKMFGLDADSHSKVDVLECESVEC